MAGERNLIPYDLGPEPPGGFRNVFDRNPIADVLYAVLAHGGATGLACPSCGTGAADLDLDHALALHRPTGSVRCQLGEIVVLAQVGFETVKAAMSVLLLDSYRADARQAESRVSGAPERPHCLPGCDRLDGHDGRDAGACMRDGAVLTPGPLDLVHRHPDIPVNIPLRRYDMALPKWPYGAVPWTPMRNVFPRASGCYPLASGAMVHVKPSCRCDPRGRRLGERDR